MSGLLRKARGHFFTCIMSETAAHLTTHFIITLRTKQGKKEACLKTSHPSSRDKIITQNVNIVIWARSLNIIIIEGGVNMKTQSWSRQSISVSSRKLCGTNKGSLLNSKLYTRHFTTMCVYNLVSIGCVTCCIRLCSSENRNLTSSKIESWSWPYPAIPTRHVTVKTSRYLNNYFLFSDILYFITNTEHWTVRVFFSFL